MKQTTTVTGTQTQKPVIGGILNIVAGGWALMAVFGLVIAIFAVRLGDGSYWRGDYYYPYYTVFIQAILTVIAVYFFITGIISMIGGIYGLQRLKWGLAIAGSITAVLCCLPLGVASTVLTAISRDEFN